MHNNIILIYDTFALVRVHISADQLPLLPSRANVGSEWGSMYRVLCWPVVVDHNTWRRSNSPPVAIKGKYRCSMLAFGAREPVAVRHKCEVACLARSLVSAVGTD